MTSGFYRNSESVCGLWQKNALALSSVFFLSTAYLPFCLFHNRSSLTSYLSLSLTGKLEIITVSPHFPRELLAPSPLTWSQFSATYCHASY